MIKKSSIEDVMRHCVFPMAEPPELVHPSHALAVTSAVDDDGNTDFNFFAPDPFQSCEDQIVHPDHSSSYSIAGLEDIHVDWPSDVFFDTQHGRLGTPNSNELGISTKNRSVKRIPIEAKSTILSSFHCCAAASGEEDPNQRLEQSMHIVATTAVELSRVTESVQGSSADNQELFSRMLALKNDPEYTRALSYLEKHGATGSQLCKFERSCCKMSL